MIEDLFGSSSDDETIEREGVNHNELTFPIPGVMINHRGLPVSKKCKM